MRGKGLTLMAGVMLAVLASAALGAGTFAYFSDTGRSYDET
jgi:predicted ribosomally synthesized peptide with SipW-like signal peptide